MKTLSAQTRLNVLSRIERGDITEEEATSILRKRGYDTSGFEDGFDRLDPKEDTLADDVLQEFEAFFYGMPEGASFGLYETDRENVEDAFSFDMPWLGEVTPSRELGRLLGGAVTGGGLFNLGRKAISPIAGSAMRRVLGDSTGRAAGLATAGAETAAAMIPETFVATSAQALRQGDLEGIHNTAALWMTLRVGGEGLQKVAGRLIRKLRKTKERTEDIDKDVQELEARITGMTNGEALSPEYLKARTDINNVGWSPEPEQSSPTLIERMTGGSEQPDQQYRPDNLLEKEAEFHDELTRQRDHLFMAGEPVEMRGTLRTFADAERMQKDLIAEGMPQMGESQGDRALRLAYDSSKVDVDYIDKGVAARYIPDENKVYFNSMLLQQKFDNKAWSKPRLEGVDPLPETAFSNYAEYKDFVHKHEVLRSTVRKLPHENDAQYENRINALALERVPNGLIETDYRFKQNGYLIREVLDQPKPLEYNARNIDPHTGASFGNPGQRRGATELQKSLDITEAEAMFLMSADYNKVHRYLRSRAEKIEGSKPGLELNKKVYDDAELVFKTRVIHAPELADLDLVKSGRPDDSTYLTDNKSDKLNTPSIISDNPGFVASSVKRGELSDIVDELHVRGIDIADPMLKRLPKNITNTQADRYISQGRMALAEARTSEKDAIAAKFKFFEETDHLDDASLMKVRPDHPAINYEPFGDEMKEVGILHKLLSPSSQQSLGRNALAYRGQFQIMDYGEKAQATKHEWFDRVAQIKEVLGVPMATGLVSATRQILNRVRQGAGPTDAAREKLYLLSQILDNDLEKPLIKGWKKDDDGVTRPVLRGLTGKEALADDPQLAQAYGLARSLLNDVADELGLSQEERIGNYLAHVFSGRTGRLRARALASRMGPGVGGQLLRFAGGPPSRDRGRELVVDKFQEMLSPKTEIPEPKMFKHLLPRTKNLSGFDYDFENVMMIYLSGAADKIRTDKVSDYGLWIHSRLPDFDAKGNPMRIKEVWGKYMKHVMGTPSEGRRSFTEMLTHKGLFDRASDAMIDWIGLPGDGRKMRNLHLSEDEWGKLPPEAHAEYLAEASDFMRQLKDNATNVDPLTGKKLGKTRSEQIRARIALKIDDIRSALANPELQQPVLQEVYRIQMIAKLGFNVAHGLINLTQTLTNLWPLVESGYVSKGIEKFLYHKKSDFRYKSGRTAKEVLKESGLLDDTTKAEEFAELFDPRSALKMVQEAALAPSRWSEKFNRGVGVLAAYEQFMDKGADHIKALQQARKISLQANFPFNVAGTPPLLRTPTMRLLFMFSSYRIHQTSFTADLIQNAVDGFRRDGPSAPAVEQLAKHMMAYGMLLGAGATGYASTNLWERSMHPTVEGLNTFEEEGPRRGMLGAGVESISGPFVDTLTDLMHLRVAEAAGEFAVPSSLRRVAREGLEMPENRDDVLNLLGLKAWKAPAWRRADPPTRRED